MTLVALAACGGSSGTGKCGSAPSPAIESTTPVAQLTPMQGGELCDWSACILGGYGAHYACGGDTTVYAEPDQATCVSSMANATCTATIADFTGCLDAIAGDPCALLTSSACTVILQCATPN